MCVIVCLKMSIVRSTQQCNCNTRGLLLGDALDGDGGAVGLVDHGPADHARYHPLNVGGGDQRARAAVGEGVDMETCSFHLGKERNSGCNGKTNTTELPLKKQYWYLIRSCHFWKSFTKWAEWNPSIVDTLGTW